MRRSLLHSLLICALLAGLCAAFFVPTGTVKAVSTLYNLGVNGIANGGAESNLSYWDNTGTVQPLSYGTTTAPGYGDPGPENRGSRLFWGSYSSGSPTKMTQRIELSYDLRQRVQEGDIAFDLSGYFGGYGTELDNAEIAIVFERLTGSEIKRLEFPPVTAADRSNKTGLLYRKFSGMVPSEAAYFEVEITFNDETHNQSSNYNFAYVDNVSLVLRRNATYLPFVIRPDSPPAAPGELTVSAGSSTVINLHWYDNSNNETGFQVERAPINTGTFALIATTAANATSYQDHSLSPATGYSYRVRAVGPSGVSGYTAVKSATTYPSAPAAPTNLSATAVTQTGATLQWTDNASNETGFELEQSVSGGAFTRILTSSQLPTNTTQAVLTNLTAGTTYDFRVRAVNQGGASTYSNSVRVIAQSAPVPPAAPTNLNASGTTSTTTTLKWTDNANNETGFELERYIGGVWVKIAGTDVLGPNSTQRTVTALDSNTTYKFRVRAVNQAGYSSWSNEVSVTTLPAPVTVPAPPSNLTYSNLTATTVKLSWVDNANNETWFDLQESVNGGAWTTISNASNLPANYTYADITNLLPDTNHSYRIRAVNSAGSSAFSNTVTFRTPPVTSQTKLRVTNNVTDDFIISLKINNVEQIPTWDKSIGSGLYSDYTLSPGSYTVVATTGWWDTQSNPPSRFEKYIWTYNVTITSGQTTNIVVNDPTIYQLMTEFGTVRAWKGYYIGTSSYGDVYFCFYSNGRYRFYDTWPDGYYKQTDKGDYSLVSYGSTASRFLVESDNGQEVYEGLIAMLYGYYTMYNGPAGWNQITYTKQTQTFSDQYCPATAP